MITVCEESALDEGASIRVESDVPIAIFKADGELYAVDDACPHQAASLSDGWVEDRAVECPLHAVCFDLRTGMPSGPPARTPVRTHTVWVEDGWILLEPVGAPVTGHVDHACPADRMAS